MFHPYGIIPAMVTPLDKDEAVSESAVRQLVNHLIEGGAHGIFALGSQGEFWAFDPSEKQRILELVVDEVAGRVPVCAGTGALTTREAIALSRMAEQAGADAVSVLTPFFISPTTQELYSHYAALAEATSLPIILYSNPSRTGVRLPPETVARLSNLENIVGIKDSSGDLNLTAEYVRVTPPGFVLMGQDALILAGLLYGCAGAIAATANVAPRLVVDIYERFKVGDLAGALEAQQRLSPLRQAFTLGTFPMVIKEALNIMGLQAGPARGPVGPLSEQAHEQLTRVLQQMGVL